MAELKFDKASKFYGDIPAVLDVDLTIPTGSFTTFVGPSGCGKSTLLEASSGLLSLTYGSISLAGEPVSMSRRKTAIVFQNHNLFEWLTVLDNVSFGLHARGFSKRQRRMQASKLLSNVGLAAYANKMPRELSGGMKQRVSIARALALSPQVLLMDEPFSALDYQTRTVMQSYLLALWHHTKATIVMVTHDLEEAIMLSDQIVLFSSSPGRVVDIVQMSSARPRDPESYEVREVRNRMRSFLEQEVASHEFTREEIAAIQKEGMSIKV